jgi:hypothetical protein
MRRVGNSWCGRLRKGRYVANGVPVLSRMEMTGTVRVWDAIQHPPIGSLTGHRRGVNTLALADVRATSGGLRWLGWVVRQWDLVDASRSVADFPPWTLSGWAPCGWTSCQAQVLAD